MGVLEHGTPLPRGPAESAFVQYGGYVYFDDSSKVIGTRGISPAAFGALGLMFGRAQTLPEICAETLTKQGRFQEITLEAFVDAGATHFAWIRPQEFAEH